MKFPIHLFKESTDDLKIVYEYTNFEKLPNGYLRISKDRECVFDNNIPNIKNGVEFGLEVEAQLLPLVISRDLPTYFTMLVDQPFESAFICKANIYENTQLFAYSLEGPELGRVQLGLNTDGSIDSITHLKIYNNEVENTVDKYLRNKKGLVFDELIVVNENFEEMKKRVLNKISNQDLTLEDIPTPYDNWNNINKFALTFFPKGGIQEAINIKEKLRNAFSNKVSLTSFSFNDLRTHLFGEQRGSNHRGDSPSKQNMVLVYEIIKAIREKVQLGHKE
ncbi:hypothetical protein [Brevibacillus sp. SYSU BS000544]|uniref:hypothetical protein n=1 Tax=Brevibacillus sp. SYSU BS000544 TaxID=3416443 RepID=UPI003CE545AF